MQIASDFSGLTRLVAGRSKRSSSWDRTGGNDDCVRIDPGKTWVLADIDGPGMITHIYLTIIDPAPLDYRDGVLRMYWDGEETPSVEVPFGDFFCVPNCTVKPFESLMMVINSGGPHPVNNGFNCYFPMPFSKGARIELVNQGPRIFGGGLGRLWYHVDYEVYDEPSITESLGRFHAQWRRECPTTVWDAPKQERLAWPAVNLSDEENYAILEAQGHGHLAGLFLQVNNLQGGWYGEGDDMIFIDGESWPPSIHGTGSEEIFGGGACPSEEYAGPYTGFLQVENRGGDTFFGNNAMYRWYMQDPVRFMKSVRWSIEHGHANDFANDYASVAYWYQAEPHALFPTLPPVEKRHPLFPERFFEAHKELDRVFTLLVDKFQDPFVFDCVPTPDWLNEYKAYMYPAYRMFYTKEYDRATELLRKAVAVAEKNGQTL